MAMEIQEKDSRFRVVWQGFSMDWIPDTSTNKKVLLVFLRSLLDDKDKHIFTFQELSVLFDSNTRQASSQHM